MSETEATPDEIAKQDEEEVLSILDMVETDVGAEEDGRWFNNVWPGADVKLRRFTSRASVRCRIRLTQKYRKFSKNGEFSEELSVKILNEQLAEAVILDWRGKAFMDREKQPIVFSREACLDMLTRMPNFRITLGMIAQDMDNFRIESQETTEKNS